MPVLQTTVDRELIRRYLATTLDADVQVTAVRSLGDDSGGDPKGLGYGSPFEIECAVDGARRQFVVSRTRPVHGFGHDYPADRAWQALYGHQAYNSFPRHVRSVDVGFVRWSGEMVSAADAADFFQLVEKADGTLYWHDLDRLLHGADLTPRDEARAVALARFLAGVHGDKSAEPALYERRIRELVGHGECVMGILDSYPHPYAILPAEACEALERALVGWRWRLRGRTHRLARVHGDFHPWNILFRDGVDFSVLDRSRGEWGEPADDVAAMAVNFLFFGIRALESPDGVGAAVAFRRLFDRFIDAYLEASGDAELLETLPPFFAFRLLVVAHPRWYPTLTDDTRAELLRLAHVLATSRAFDAGALWVRPGAGR